ncbi:hypothetical protein CC85DRAFT_284451 [Cutaneotrichosporon oleaginosum]|uniref:Uncharacterized protein n=1 Tax=Cutaneotrichosporon oleaginosum TaxID=879819 RepID=A0A0J1B729_9TREE|nr:uncharacterized protein CC85DRAFT_284451 [Cutaneotrichosporon oleaginosum]KLT43529.1 hypothetical protein CC85DRAFT_284451 [Cutaneotrichosporon oleaginosum]TXT05572.1 hypothetical protein COLE_06892 [Cutaneotrichosporon oleaginosum]
MTARSSPGFFGDKARDVFLKSQLNYDKLGQIWNLADTQQRGALDLPDFIIGMWLIRNCMANPSLSLPAALPPGAYEAASGGRPPVPPLSVQNTGQASPLQRQMTGTLQPQLTGQSLSAAGHAQPRSAMTPTRQGTHSSITASSAAAWDITPEGKATSDRFFDQLDTQNVGVIEGDVAVPFMLQSQLDEASLATIWDLADVRQEGKLDRDEFAVAMYLISSKLAGKDLPTTLPASLVPPSLRSHELPVHSQQSSAAKDLFDLFDDSPTQNSSLASAPATAFLPQPPSRRGTAQEAATRRVETTHTGQGPTGLAAMFSKPTAAADLLGDDAQESAASSVPDASAEIGNKRNQLANTVRSLTDLQRNRTDLEERSASNASQLEQLESELAVARAKYDEETKIVAELRLRVGEQTARLSQLQANVISAQSDLTARKMEKDELEQTFLRDKEEVRGLQKRMKEIEDEKTGIKLLLEKVKKEARQQKGMVSIAKKQLSTAEGSRDTLQQQVREAENAAAAETEVPEAASTPRALSPDATGTSQRSYNPFDRFSRKRSQGSNSGSISEFATPLASPGFAGAAVGGAVAAGAAVAHFGLQSDGKGPTISSPPREESEVDAFGAPIEHFSSAPGVATTDPFGGTPFGDDRLGPRGDVDDKSPTVGFGDSFNAAASQRAPADANGASTGMSDFDAAFADFDTKADATSSTDTHPELQESVPTEAPSAYTGPSSVGVGISTPSAFDADRPEAERAADAQGVPPSSITALTTADKIGTESSDDEDEGPEDLEGPRREYPSSPPRRMSPPPVTGSPPLSAAASGPPEDLHPKTRRSAPPPPAVRSFGATSPPPAIRSSGPTSPTVRSPGTTSPPIARSPGVVSPSPAVSPLTQSPTATRGIDPFSGSVAASPAVAGPPALIPSPAVQSTSLETTPAKADPSAISGSQAAAFAEGQDPLGSAIPSSRKEISADGAKDQFDDSDFDFPDLPSAHSTQVPPQASAVTTSSFDDEFATFDEEFDQTPSHVNDNLDQSNSNSLRQSYEVVPSPQRSRAPDLDAWGLSGDTQSANAGAMSAFSFDDAFGQPQHLAMPGGFDEAFGQSQEPTQRTTTEPNSFNDSFGEPKQLPARATQDGSRPEVVDDPFGAPQTAVEPNNSTTQQALSFDDAFGGSFVPESNKPNDTVPSTSGPSTAGAAPHASGDAVPPALPQRPSVQKEPSTSDLPQPDDLKEVKRLCDMGFPRSLVVEALDANGYDFQKALNVLLVK